MTDIGQYDPKAIEEKWSRFWIEKALYHVPEPSKEKKFSVVIPPPNVTGSLHMGHALNATLQDVVVRWRRMQGRECVWVPGFDHAGIATQYVVEKQLAREGLSRLQLGREEFLKKVWEWVPKSRKAIRTQLTKLGVSVDWKRERFTLDEGFSRAVREAFRRLYEEGLVYRAEYIVNWCPKDQTALSDLEVEHEEEAGALWYISYPVVDEEGRPTGESITVATTRPETMLGDTAVAVHPEDERYKHLIGKRVKLPLVDWKRTDLRGNEVSPYIPVIADRRVKREFGTGAVKITPAHDPLDFEIGKDHGLPFVKVIDEEAKMTENAGDFAGMDRYEAREAVVAKLKELELLEKEEEITHSVGHCYRCKTVVEPMVSVQWFVKVSDPRIKEKAIEAVEKLYEEVEEKTAVSITAVEEMSLRIEEGERVLILGEGLELVAVFEGEKPKALYHLKKVKEPLSLLEKLPKGELVALFEGKPRLAEGGVRKELEEGKYLLVLKEGKAVLLKGGEEVLKLEGELKEDLSFKALGSSRAELSLKKKKPVGVRFIPERWKRFYLEWMHNLKDWCISRQIWWGHRIPVWYCEDCGRESVFTDADFPAFIDKLLFNLYADGKVGEVFTPEEVIKVLKSPNFVHPEMSVLDFYKRFVFHAYHASDVSEESLLLHLTREAGRLYKKEREGWKLRLTCKHCGSERLRQEEDVLDTWFSSALWPFGVFGWPEETRDLKNLYPTDLLVTGFDIIFFWVARMLMMGTHFMGEVPFYDVYVHALVRDKFGRKMSKTLGNVIDPLEVIEKYGADALRFTLAVLTVQGRDIKLAEEKFGGYRHFANKIWNAARFVLMNTPEDFLGRIPQSAPLKEEDKWILTRLNETAKTVNEALEAYDYSRAAQALYEFFWSDFCDWYIEFTKGRMYKKPSSEEEKPLVEAEKTTALYTLHYALEKALRLLHPFMPYVTEELWQKLPLSEGESVSLAPYPKPDSSEEFPEEEREVEKLKELISAVRSLRSALEIKPSEKVAVSVKVEDPLVERVIEKFREHLLNLARLSSLEKVSERPEGTVATFVKGAELYLHAEGLVKVEELLSSYKKKREKLLTELERKEKKLSNENFLKKAPPEVVEKERSIYEELKEKLSKLEELIGTLERGWEGRG